MNKERLIVWLKQQASNARIDQLKAEHVRVEAKYSAQVEVYEFVLKQVEDGKFNL